MLPLHRRSRLTRLRCRLAIPLLLAGLLCGPCGQAIAASSGPAPVDACTLLTKADVEALAGALVGEPNGKESGRPPFWVSMCNYDNTQTEAPMLSVGLLVKAHGADAGPAHAYETYVAELRRAIGDLAVPVPLEGLAGPAGWNADSGQLTLFVGPYQIILTVTGRFAADPLSLAKQIADLVSSRLPTP